MQSSCDNHITSLDVSVTTFHTFLLTDTILATWWPSNAWSNKHVIYICNHKYMPYTSKFIVCNIFHKILEATIIIYGTQDLLNLKDDNYRWWTLRDTMGSTCIPWHSPDDNYGKHRRPVHNFLNDSQKHYHCARQIL